MAVAVIVENVMLQRTMKVVTSTNVVSSKRVTKSAAIAANFLAQSSSSSAIILCGYTICLSSKISEDRKQEDLRNGWKNREKLGVMSGIFNVGFGCKKNARKD